MNTPADVRTLGDVLVANASVRSGREAFQTLDGRSVTFGDFNRRVNRLSSSVAGGAPLGVHGEVLSSHLGVPCIDPIEAGVTALQDASVARREARAPFGNQVYLDKQCVGEFSFLYRLNQMLRDKS